MSFVSFVSCSFLCFLVDPILIAIFLLLLHCRFVVDENINGSTGISIWCVFDGHGGEFAADFAKDILVQNLYNKIIESAQIAKNKKSSPDDEENDLNCGDRRKKVEEEQSSLVQRKPSLKRVSKADDAYDSKKPNNIDADILGKLKSKDSFSMFKQTASGEAPPPPKTFDAKCYVQGGNKINYGKMITDEVLAADHKLVEKAKRQTNVAGTTVSGIC